MTVAELFTNPPTAGVSSPLAQLSVPITTTPAAGTIESYAVSAAAPLALRAASGRFRVLVDHELMVVTAKVDGSSPWEFERGAEGSTPAPHSSGAAIHHVLTAGALATKADLDSGTGLLLDSQTPAAVAATLAGLGSAATHPAGDFDPAGAAAAAQAAAEAASDAAGTAAADVAVEVARAEAAEALLIPLTERGAANGVGSLDSGGKQPAGELRTDVLRDTRGSADQDILVLSGGTFVRLPIGLAGQQLLVRSDGTLKYTTPPTIYAAAWGVGPSASASTNATQGQAAIDAAAGNGDVVFPGGVLQHSTAFVAPRNATGLRIHGVGRGATIFQPTAAAKNCITTPFVADGDLYQNLEFSDFSVDCTNLPLPANNQCVIGSQINGGELTHGNFDNITCRRIRIYNLALKTNQTGVGQYSAFIFSGIEGGTSVAAGSNGVDVTTFNGTTVQTLNVGSTAGCRASGTLRVQVSATPTGIVGDAASRSYATLSYTSKTSNAFGGVTYVSGGTGTLVTGYAVMEGVQTVNTNILFEDLRVEGGNNGYVVATFGSTALGGTNSWVDNVIWSRCYHDCGGTRVLGDSFGGGQMGGAAQGGLFIVKDCVFKNHADTYEFDCMETLYVSNTVIEDGVNGIFVHNVANPVSPLSQTAVFDRCQIRLRNYQTVAAGGTSGFVLGAASNQTTGFNTFGHVILHKCSLSSTVPGAVGNSQFMNCSRYIRRVSVLDCTLALEGLADISTGSQQCEPMLMQPLTSCHVVIRNLGVRVQGSTTNASLLMRPLQLGATSVSAANTNLHLDIDGINWLYNVTGFAAGQMQLLGIVNSSGPGSCNWQGRIGKVRIARGATSGTSTAPRPFTIATNAAYPINTALVIEDCDFTESGSSSFDISGPDAAQLAKIYTFRNQWKTRPVLSAPIVVTPGASPYAYQNTTAFAQEVVVAGGTVTDISYSADNSTYYTTGWTSGKLRVEPGEYLKVTGSGYTMTAFPPR